MDFYTSQQLADFFSYELGESWDYRTDKDVNNKEYIEYNKGQPLVLNNEDKDNEEDTDEEEEEVKEDNTDEDEEDVEGRVLEIWLWKAGNEWRILYFCEEGEYQLYCNGVANGGLFSNGWAIKTGRDDILYRMKKELGV